MNERIERAKEFVEKKTTYGKTSDLIVRLCAEFAESEISRGGEFEARYDETDNFATWRIYFKGELAANMVGGARYESQAERDRVGGIAKQLVGRFHSLPTNLAARAIAERIVDAVYQHEGLFACDATERITDILSTALPRWIPIIEQKPTTRGMYRITDSGNVYRAYYEPRQGVFTTPGGHEYFTNVTAYMPEWGPEPYVEVA